MSILQISLREADETKYWLELLAEAEIVPPALLHDIREECEELIRVLATAVKSAKQRPE